MDYNSTYLDDISVEKAIRDLVDICQKCSGHGNSKDSYTSPSFQEQLRRALTLDDIPMQSCAIDEVRPIREDMQKAPWEDCTKNFILDMISVNTSSKFDVCILLSETGYRWQEATINIIASKYGVKSPVLIDVIPCESETDFSYKEFEIRIRHREVCYVSTVNYETLVSNIIQWYEPNSTIVFCHDNSISEYQESITMMPQSMWSVSCSYSNYIVNRDGKKCTYVCPTFNCPGSLETRVVGRGNIHFTESTAPAEYRGKLDYYLRCIRISKHMSGKCYDCATLGRIINSLHNSPLSTPISLKFTNFSPTFLKSLDSNSESPSPVL